MGITINNSVSVLRLLSNINRIGAERAVTMNRLATGKQITRASDDPAGLVALNALVTIEQVHQPA